MTIKIGDRLPEGTLSEFIEVESAGCSVGPNTFNVGDLTKGKKIAVFGLPGAYTPTCSAQHVPGYVKHAAELKAKGGRDLVYLGQRRICNGCMGPRPKSDRHRSYDG